MCPHHQRFGPDSGDFGLVGQRREQGGGARLVGGGGQRGQRDQLIDQGQVRVEGQMRFLAELVPAGPLPRECQKFCARGFSLSGSGCLSVTVFSHYLLSCCPGLSRGSAEPDFPCRSGADAACPGFPGVLCCCGRLLPDPPGIAWRAVPVCH